MYHAQKGSKIFDRSTCEPPNRRRFMLYDVAFVLKSDYIRFSDSKETGRDARRRKLPVNARDLVIPHGRLTRNCVHYRRIRFGGLRTRPALGVYTEGVCYMTPKLALINKYKIIFLVS